MSTVNALSKRKPVANLQKSEGFARMHGLNHVAYRCRDAEETRHFYEDILKLPLSFVVYHDRVPSTGDYQLYYHIFFELADGSHIAFFDLLDGKVTEPDPDTPTWLNHIAFDVETREDLLEAKATLEAAGVDVLGIVDHKIFDSIYFFDPNGIRLELVYRTAPLALIKDEAAHAHKILAGRKKKIEALRRAAK